jgi:hypothetical protein
MPKVSFRVTEKFYAGGGILYVHVPSSEYVGICYGMTSYGTPDANVTAGIGWGFVEGSFSKDPIVTISGMKRISRKIALLTENWFIPADGVTSVWSYGLRFLGEKLSVDLGFINNKDIAEILLIGVPYVDFVVKF